MVSGKRMQARLSETGNRFDGQGRKNSGKKEPDVKIGSFAPFADIFRLEMLAATDLLWVDLDAFLLHPLRYLQGNSGGGVFRNSF